MALVLKNFSSYQSVSGIWEIVEPEDFFLASMTLSKHDFNLLNSINSSARRTEFLATRHLIKELGLNIEIEYKKNGKPTINQGHISISHSDSLVSIIYHPKYNCAIDIEKISDRMLRIAKRAFSEKEISFAENNLKNLTTLWGCKEAIYKIVHEDGISFKNQIQIEPFKQGEKIICNYHNNKKKEQFILYSLEIMNHILVWCVNNE